MLKGLKTGLLGLSLGLCLMAITAKFSYAAAGSGIGLGAVIGKPTGLTAKVWQGRTNALDFSAGWSLSGNHIDLTGDYVWHNYSLIPVSRGQFPVYYGMGGAVGIGEGPGIGMGIRIVGGLEYLFPDAPLDRFHEVAPVAVIFPDAGIDVHAGLGMRFFF